MAENTQQPPNNNDGTLYVASHEPEARSAPRLETGWVAWVRSNLFSSEINTILTFIGFFLAIFSIWSMGAWVIQRGNWFTVSFNFRSFMVGQYEPLYEWRVVLSVLATSFVFGMAIAVWIKQIARTMLITVIVTLLLMWGLPILTASVYDLPPWYTSAGTAEIVSGSQMEVPTEQVAFTGQAGEAVTIRLSDIAGQNDAELAQISGFMDSASNTLRNAAIDRIDAIEEENSIFLRLEEYAESDVPTLTDSQFEDLQEELATYDMPQRIVEQYNINTGNYTVEVDILEAVFLGDNQWEYSRLATDPMELTSLDDEASYTLPRDGWYILEKRVINDEGQVAILDVSGVYPLLQSTSFDPDARVFVDTFRRMTDFYSLAQPVPRIEGDDVPFIVVIQNQFRGERDFGTYLRTYVAPFFEVHAMNTTILLLLSVVGYAVAVIMQNSTQKGFTTEFTSYAMISLPILIWILVNGLTLSALALWIMVAGIVMLSTAMGTFARSMGSAGWRNFSLPIMLVVAYGALFGLAWFSDGGGFAKLLVYLSFIPLVLVTVLGANAHSPEGLEDGEQQSMMVNFGIAIAIYVGVFAAFSFGWVSVDAEWLLTPSDPDRWGGLLLTMLLTIFGIICAFPLGVGLALGRRSDLPAVSAICTGYIELVRGSPFITVLFFMQLLIPLINADFANVPNSYRALIGVIIFSAAYLAENVRGGLQSLPPGQTEAAKALGLNAWQTTRLITLPQALRAVIPALVGQFISLFKDTSLVSVVGLTDLTRIVSAVVAQAAFIGTRQEALLFISIIYFVFSYVMSYVSRLLEASGSGSTRRM